METIKKEDLKENSLEKVFLKPLQKCKREPMSNFIGQILITILMASHEEILEIYNKFKEKAWVIKAMEKRIKKCLTITIDKQILILITSITEGNIGKCIMYIYYLQYWGKLNNTKEITIELLSTEIFPIGFFNEKELHKIWDKQKIASQGYDNMIDISFTAKSIMF